MLERTSRSVAAAATRITRIKGIHPTPDINMIIGTNRGMTTDTTAEEHAIDIMITTTGTDIMTDITIVPIDTTNTIETVTTKGVRNTIDITTEIATIDTIEDQDMIIEDTTIVDIDRGMKLRGEQAAGIVPAEAIISRLEDQKAPEDMDQGMPVRGIMEEEVMIITETGDGEINCKYNIKIVCLHFHYVCYPLVYFQKYRAELWFGFT